MGGGAAAEEPASSSFFTAFCVCGRDDEVLKPPPVHDESVAVVENDLDVPGAEDVVELRPDQLIEDVGLSVKVEAELVGRGAAAVLA